MAAASRPAPARAPERKTEPQPQTEPQRLPPHSTASWQRYLTPALVVLLAAAVVCTMSFPLSGVFAGPRGFSPRPIVG